jgi:hypothetical protein
MNTEERILVIFLSVALAIFLTLAIAVMVLTLQILNKVKRISDKAEDLADKAEAVGEFFQKTAGPATLAKSLTKMFKMYSKHQKNKE